VLFAIFKMAKNQALKKFWAEHQDEIIKTATSMATTLLAQRMAKAEQTSPSPQEKQAMNLSPSQFDTPNPYDPIPSPPPPFPP
jgi:hypothetical protein